MKTYPRKTILNRIICIITVVFILLGQGSYAAAADDEANVQYLDGIIQLIRDQYRGEISDSNLLEGAVRGMLNSLDEFTTYYDNEEKESFMDSITGVFGGIGVALETSGDYIVISKVFPATPAERAGLLQGDKIVEADGVNLLNAKASPDRVASVIKGKPGTKVRLGILRGENGKVRYIDVTREVVKINPVTYEIRDGVGYIKIETFNENTDEFVTKALAEMDKNKITKIILDLRDNPGGEVSQAVAVARKFVPKGLITKLDYQSSRYPDVEYYSYLEQVKYKLAVLINGKSASASEIVAGAIQDTGVGKLIGTKTYGKAKFQSMIPILTVDAFKKYKSQTGISAVNGYDLQFRGIFPSNDEITGYAKLTLGVYYTPKGRMIDGTGLKPDIEVKDPEPVSGISINGVQKLSKTVVPGLNSQGVDVYNAEKILKIMGYKIETPDITLDARTINELKIYQKNSGLRASGILDFKTQDALNADLDKLVRQYDRQYSAALIVLNL